MFEFGLLKNREKNNCLFPDAKAIANFLKNKRREVLR